MQLVKSLELPAQLHQTLKTMKFSELTPTQAQAIPAALRGRDLFINAQVSSATIPTFTIPLVSRLTKLPNRSGLILVSDKSTAKDIETHLNLLIDKTSALAPVFSACGKNAQTALRALGKKPRVIIAQPDTLVELIRRGMLSISTTEVAVVCDANELLESKMDLHLSEIIRFLPKSRQTIFCSGADTPASRKLSQKFLKDPVEVSSYDLNRNGITVKAGTKL